MGPWQLDTGRMELKDRREGKLFGRPEWTSSLARTDGTNTHRFFFGSANVTCGARDFFPRWVKIETCRFIGGRKCASISSVALLAIISSGALVYEFQRKIMHAPEFRMQILQDINASVHTLKRHSIVGLHSYCSKRRNGS